MTWTCC